MIPEGEERVDADVAQLIYAEVTRRFDEEDHWRVELESKAGTFLGFLGVFLGIVLVYGASARSGASVPVETIAVPIALQVASALLLLRTIYGRGQFVGPSPRDVASAGQASFAELAMQLASVYAVSILANRIRHQRTLAGYHLALLLSAAGLVQLAFSTLAESVRQTTPSGGWPLSLVYWLPGLLLILSIAGPLRRGYAIDRREAEETLYRSGFELGSRWDDSGGGEK